MKRQLPDTTPQERAVKILMWKWVPYGERTPARAEVVSKTMTCAYLVLFIAWRDFKHCFWRR